MAPPATDQEVRDAARQFVRKLSGFRKPSRANEAAFEQAIDEVSAATLRLFEKLTTAAPPRDRTAVRSASQRERYRR